MVPPKEPRLQEKIRAYLAEERPATPVLVIDLDVIATRYDKTADMAAQLIEEPCLGNLERGATADLVLLQGDLRREGVTQLRGRVRGVWQAGERVR